jgi:hypothetical protein
MRVNYPIAIDNDYAIWNAFSNNYWPALYFVDAGGRIRHHHFGEGEYEETERVLQQLLNEAGATGVDGEPVNADARGAEVAADWADLRSPESYLGLGRSENFASPGGAVRGKSHVYTAPTPLKLNQWALTADWTFENEYAVLNDGGGRIVYQFNARDVHLVMGPGQREDRLTFRCSSMASRQATHMGSTSTTRAAAR